uniref:Light chain fibroin LCF-4 n=1 Tax=Phymatopus californicus TaxID=1407613 RepID=D7PBW2_9NEOP|nr:light chain fibroin LCF-4 [Phymatopus californicus]
MIPIIVLSVLLAAQGAYGASISYVPIEDVPIRYEFGNTINRNVLDNAFQLVDGASVPIHALTLHQATLDLADQPDGVSQSIAAGQTLGILGELTSPVAGDTCGYSQLVDSYNNYHTTGNRADLNNAIDSYVGSLNRAVDQLVLLRTNPAALRNQAAVVHSCSGGGRSYGHDKVWDLALSNAGSVAHADLINEQQCSSRRLYGAWDRRSNSVAAAAAAAVTSPGHQVVRGALPQIASFLNTAVAGGNTAAAGQALKQALTQSSALVKSKY